ncbi:MAG: YhdH/YhfP family quinone oxidoreductase, partial [Pseudohongiellaceae bacterium]
MTAYNAFVVSETSDGEFAGKIKTLDTSDLPAGDVLIKVQYSSLNYKDALSAAGNKGVTRQYPHTPGIDAAGSVVEANVAHLNPGEEVIVVGYDLGMNTAGGFGEYIRVPGDWVVRKPASLGLRASMILGTAGFTAALCVDKLLAAGLDKDSGEVLVSGATGGVGSVAVALLAKLGYDVAAVTGKAQAESWLRDLGARTVIDRSELGEANPKPLLKPRWAGAVDTVGGPTLVNIIKSLHYGCSVAACGMVQSPALELSVFPFILRGVNLLGVDSVELALPVKQAMWDKLGGDWQLDNLESLATEITPEELDSSLRQLLAGKARGRFLLKH